MTDIYIVRHGNTFDKGDTITRVGARTDLPLSSSGQTQAEALALHFMALVPAGFSAAYCSELQRTRQTAETILAVRDKAPALATLEFLREVDYGVDENQPEDAVIARIGEAALVAWDKEAVPPPGWEVDPEALKGEWRDLLKSITSEGAAAPVLIVTSNGIARFVLDAITEFEIQPKSIKLKTGAYGHLRASGDSVKLVRWNVRP
ncbi:MAG: histidine phosphatase family protein [Pseudomonadota bacterium]